MTSKNIIKNIGDILLGDPTITSYISNRLSAKGGFKASVTPYITLWIDCDDGNVGINLPAGRYSFEVGVWNSSDKSQALETLLDIKDRVVALLNKQETTINAGTHTTKVRTFDLVSAVRSDEYLGSLKLWYLPCIFECIIGD